MMTFGLGDLAQTFTLQRRGADLKAQMARLNDELATGQVSDIKSVLAGNVSYLTDIETDLKTLEGYKVAGIEAAQFASSAQSALERIDGIVNTLSSNLLTVSSSAVGPVLDQISVDAQNDLSSILAAMNTSSAGRSLFSGVATDTPAVTDAQSLLDDLRVAVAGAATPIDIKAAVDQWFNDPAGYSSTGYLGSDTSLAPMHISEDETITLGLTADDDVFRDILKAVTVAALAADSSLALSSDQQQELLTAAGSALFEAKAQLTATQSDLGATEARIDTIETRNAARKTSLEYAKGALLEADPYETATNLEAVQFQLQSLYTVTARMSDLSLVNFIR
ncbi:MAG: flagellin [Tateyamaria sp.]